MEISFKEFSFLAHQSLRLMGDELIVYQSLRRPSVFCPSVNMFNIFSSETTGPIKLKFHIETLQDVGTKVCSYGPGHMTKMAVMPIYGKNLLKPLQNQKADDLGTLYVALGM